MPGYANWQELYQLEYLQLFEEGYPVGDGIEPDLAASYLSDEFRGKANKDTLSEADWEQAYRSLWQVREEGIRPDYAFAEPDDYDAIIADAADVPHLEPLSDSEYAERVKGAWYW